MTNLKYKSVYICAFLTAIVLGLSSRAFADQLPLVVSRHAGDALWGSMVYFGFRILIIKESLLLSLTMSLLFSFGIEFSQLYQSEWINDIRSSLLGGLVLGQGFLWADLVRYAVGIALAFILDSFIVQQSRAVSTGKK